MFSPDEQRAFWNDWNASTREQGIDGPCEKRGETALRLVASLGLSDPQILEVGCGSGWLTEGLQRLGRVVAVDLADEVIARAQKRLPAAQFRAGDVEALVFPEAPFDVIVTLETLSHVEDQPRFIAHLAGLLKRGGHLVLTTQNRFVFERRDDVTPQARGQLRRWVHRSQLRALLSQDFDVLQLDTLLPEGHGGILRLINSVKLRLWLGALVGEATVERWKERAGLGQTLVAFARRR